MFGVDIIFFGKIPDILSGVGCMLVVGSTITLILVRQK